MLGYEQVIYNLAHASPSRTDRVNECEGIHDEYCRLAHYRCVQDQTASPFSHDQVLARMTHLLGSQGF